MDLGGEPPRYAKEGDLVLLQERRDVLVPLVLTRGAQLENRHGKFLHDDMIGAEFGSQVTSDKQRFMVMLLPTPELWTLSLPHRTQIVYTTDISHVVLRLNLKPGSVVVESGTGSGSLSTSLARSVAPTGHVHTFEFNAMRAEMATKEFKRNGLSELITCTHGDACQGFGSRLDGAADAVFLDLPSPWLAVHHAAKCLRIGGRLCSYSPCIEQVQRTCTALRACGFTDVETVETLLRPYDNEIIPGGDAPGLRVWGFGSDNPKADAKKGDASPGDDATAVTAAAAAPGTGAGGAGAGSTAGSSATGGDAAASTVKVVKGMRLYVPPGSADADAGTDRRGRKQRGGGRGKKRARDGDDGAAGGGGGKAQRGNLGRALRPMATIRGHTAYLTFASLVKRVPPSAAGTGGAAGGGSSAAGSGPSVLSSLVANVEAPAAGAGDESNSVAVAAGATSGSTSQ